MRAHALVIMRSPSPAVIARATSVDVVDDYAEPHRKGTQRGQV